MDICQGTSQAIATAREAQARWQQIPLKKRATSIAKFASLVVKHRKALADGILYPTRTGYQETLTAELLPLAETAKWLSENASRVLQSRKTSKLSTPMWLGSLRSRVDRVPRGVVLILGTWNYPIFLTGSQLLHALVAGNAVVIKPAPGCEQVTSLLGSMCSECSIPEDLVQVLDSSVQAGVDAMEQGVDHVVMTGSSRSGRKVLEQSIQSLSSTTLELSGSDAVIVLPSADIERVTNLLRFGLRLNGGATCIAPRRVFVLETMLEAVTKLLSKKLTASGQPPQSTWMTSNTYLQLQPAIQDAMDQGAALVVPWHCDLEARKTLPYPQNPSEWVSTSPIVLSHIRPEMKLYGIDVFAPLMTLIPVKNIQQALEFNAQCRYGLCVSLFGNEQEAASLAHGICAGSVIINDFVVPTADPRLPFGGRQESGFGVTRGEEGLLEMTVPQVISIRHGKWLPHSDLPHPQDEHLLDGLLQFRHGETWTLRISGLRKLLASIRRNPNQKK